LGLKVVVVRAGPVIGHVGNTRQGAWPTIQLSRLGHADEVIE
jgi:hypothetical protein